MNKTDFPEDYLPFINTTMSEEPCIHKSLLTIWQKKDDDKIIDTLNKTEILMDVTATLQNK